LYSGANEKPLSISIRKLLCGFLERHNPDLFGLEFELLLALRTNAIMPLNYLIWRLKFETMI
jgi:hypothetical protein